MSWVDQARALAGQAYRRLWDGKKAEEQRAKEENLASLPRHLRHRLVKRLTARMGWLERQRFLNTYAVHRREQRETFKDQGR